MGALQNVLNSGHASAMRSGSRAHASESEGPSE